MQTDIKKPVEQYGNEDVGNQGYGDNANICPSSSACDRSLNIQLEDALDLGWKILADCFDRTETGIKTSLLEQFWPNKD